MRFAYIDSQGNEVSIPSVDALALRIELGAINSETQLYDEQADYWGPASTHEIFHTLSRDQGEEGFVAPPPMVPPPPPVPEAPVVEEPAPEAAEEPAPLPPAEEPEDEPPAEEPEDEPPAEEPVFQPLADDPDEPSVLGPLDPLPTFDVSREFDARGEFDVSAEFEAFEEEAAGADAPASDDLNLSFSPPPEDSGASDSFEADGVDFGGGHSEVTGFETTSMEGEPMSFSGDLDPVKLGGGLDPGSLPSEIPGEDQVVWDEQAGATDSLGGTDTGDLFPPTGPGSPPEVDRPPPGLKLSERPEPKDRPSAPRRPRKARLPVMTGIIAVLGVGGFFGWKVMGGIPLGPDPEETASGLPTVFIPEIPAELMPTMRELADAAMADLIAEFRRTQRGLRLPSQPNDDWLSGAYLGAASQFDDVEAYWLGFEAFFDGVRELDAQVFHDRYVASARAARIPNDTATILVKRADSGFLAAREDRFELYRTMDDLINASLDLHVFLIDNELDITYDPAAGGMSSDPVLQASPSTEALGDEMWGMLDNITRALSALGITERVTTERLTAALLGGIQSAGVW